MQDLMVVGFHGTHRASEVLAELEQLALDWTLDLADGVAAYRTEDGRLRIDQSVQPTTKEGAAFGAMVGGVLAALLVGPFTGGLSAAGAAITLGFSAATGGSIGGAIGADDAGTVKRAHGISEEFVEQVGGMIQPGDSAVFILVRRGDPEAVAEKFRGYGGSILRTSLPGDVRARVQETLRADAGGAS